MNAFGKSQSLKRLEDVRFLTGHGRYIDDTVPERALFAYFLRSPTAHADFRKPDFRAARKVPGVAGVFAIDDLEKAGLRAAMTTEIIDADSGKGAAPERPFLARGRVRFVGEAVALIVAETMEAAKDAAEAIEIDYRDRDVHVDYTSPGPVIHPEAPGNVAFDWQIGGAKGTDTAIRKAAHVVRMSIPHNRVIGNSMEPRGAWAEWADGRLHVSVSGQGVWTLRNHLATAFRLGRSKVRVTTPDVGGGFGMKGLIYPEYFAIAHAARATGRPVRWMSERTEAMLTDTAGRDLLAEIELAFDTDHRITAYRVNVLSNLGAYNSSFAQFIQSELFSKVFTGAYAIPNGHLRVKGIYTNTAPVDAYRGAGRPEAILTLERAMDMAARQLGTDPWELRRKNFITVFPYRTPSRSLYDCGDFPRVLGRARAEADAKGFPQRREKAAKAGKLRGMGTCYYIESILGDKNEFSEIEFAPDGLVNLYVGTQSNGQGHETVYSKFLADQTGIDIDRIRVIQGDSDRIKWGGGTGGSRSVTVQSTATLKTVEAMVAAFAPFIADQLGVKEVSFQDGSFRAPGSNIVVTLTEAADRARAAGRSDLLRHRAEAVLQARSFPNGCHVAEVEVDPETGAVDVVRYTVTDDFGNLLNPTLVQGQIHGGVAQGLGQALMENGVYDETGQLLSATFMDYAMPRAADVPFVDFSTEPVPTAMNPLGMKGCGEAGTVGALGAISNAVLDALWPLGVRDVSMPCSPQRVWAWIEEAKGKGASVT